ncbi:MAG: hypothetical protein KF819_30820 [Labilithrix sp.]|nr:hypothetical protein [Labilithrix sp.]
MRAVLRACVLFAAIGGATIGVLACGEALEIEDDGPRATDGATTNDASGGAVNDGVGASDASDASDGPTACRTETVRLDVEADTSPPISGDCDGANGHGVRPFSHLSPNNEFLLLRFDLSPATRDILRAGGLRAMRILLTADESCGGTCAFPAEAGVLQAHVLRNDWDEGIEAANYSGADRCRRTSGEANGAGWGTQAFASATSLPIASPVDYGSSVGAQMFTNAASSVAIFLAPAETMMAWTGQFSPAPASTKISFYVRAMSGRFVAAAKGLVPNPNAAKLVIEHCAPGAG